MQALKLSFLFILISFGLSLKAAWITKTPQTITQPDGSVIHCFATGDEYYNWLHDADGYTIIQSATDGYYSYANLIDGILVSTPFIVGKVGAAETGLKPNINISPEKMQAKREAFIEKHMPEDLSVNRDEQLNANKNKGLFTNLVVYIRFSDQPEYDMDTATFANLFNNTAPTSTSMINYFRHVSYNQLTIPSYFYPKAPGTKIVSYQDINPRKYYMPYNATSNPDGYDDETEGQAPREHALLKRAVAAIESQVPADLNLDHNQDGKVDNVVFIIRGGTTAWSTLLWPHRWSLSSYNVTIQGKRVWDYNFQLETHLLESGSSVLCHEMNHSLGAPDLYHYKSSPIDAVGSWDLMCSNTSPPQSMGAYMKYRYGGWIDQIPEIKECGTYTLNPISSPTNNCFKVASPNSKTDFFVFEYRKREGIFEGKIPGSGLLIYKINSSMNGKGNAQGPPDEVYIYRPNGTLTVDGTLSGAAFSQDYNRTAFNDNSNPKSFLSDGKPAGLKVSNITKAGETISFDIVVNKKPEADFIASTPLITKGCSTDFTDKSSCGAESWEWYFPGGTPERSVVQNPKGISYEKDGLYDVMLIARNASGADTTEYKQFINVSATASPVISFAASDTSVCTGNTITLFDHSKVCPNSWIWSITPGDGFEFINGTSKNSQNPEIRFNKQAEYSIKLLVGNKNGSSELTRNAFVHVGGYTAGQFSESFEKASLKELGWTVVNPDNSYTWELFNVGGSGEGKKAIGINLYNYTGMNKRDQIISPPLNMTKPGSYALTFNYSYSNINKSRSDSLIVYASPDCGATWTRVLSAAEDGTGNFITRETVPYSFTPVSQEDWCNSGTSNNCYNLDLSFLQGKSNVKIMFESVNIVGNNLFIDDIGFKFKESLVSLPSAKASKLGIYPNPSSGIVSINIPEVKENIIIGIYNAQGQLIRQVQKNQAAYQSLSVDLSNQPKGIYFIKITGNTISETRKLILK